MLQLEETKSTELLAAIKKEDVKEVMRLIEAGADVNAVVDKEGWTPLHMTAFLNKSKATKVLIDLGADINAKDKGELTPLHLAAQRFLTKEVKVLIEAGADVNSVDKKGRTPLCMPILYAYGYVTDIVKVLIDLGADINVTDQTKRTPLHMAAAHNYTDICEIILNHIARLEVAGLYVSEENLQKKNEFINTSNERYNNYSHHFKNCEEEVKKIKERNKSLYDFLRENDVNKMAGIWEQDENVRNEFDNEENLKKLYPEYAHILINKANELKKEIFLHNHKPLIDILSKNYEKDFQKMSFIGIENFFMSHKSDDGNLRQETGVTLINCLDFEDVKERHVPKLKVRVFAQMIKNKGINSHLEYPSTEQTQGASQSLN